MDNATDTQNDGETHDPAERQAIEQSAELYRRATRAAAQRIATAIRHAIDHKAERWINTNEAVTWGDLLFVLDHAAENEHSAAYRAELVAAGVTLGDGIVTG